MSRKPSKMELHRELDRSRSDYQRLFQVVPCYITVQDRDFRIVESNELFRQDFGECDGQHCYRAYKSRDEICPGCVVEASLQDGEVHTRQEKVTTRDGRELDIVVTSMPIRDDAGTITGVMEMSTDITEVMRLQMELARMGHAVASMAHRMKNVLMGLEGGIFVTNEGFLISDEEVVQEGWDMVQRNVDKVSSIAKDLLYCSKEREPRLEEGVSPESIAQDVFDLFSARAESEGIHLALEVGPEPHYRTLDPDGVESLLTNLVGNAIDACRFDEASEKNGHTITIRCREHDQGGTLIQVEDNGVGIPDDLSEKVFESYFSTKGTEGTGLGLLVVYKVVEEHGGAITFHSTPGEGTVFTVTFPALSAKEPLGESPW